jgi:hypothetical protein
LEADTLPWMIESARSSVMLNRRHIASLTRRTLCVP